MYSESVCLKELIESGSESNFSSQYPMRKALDIHCNKLSSNIFWSLSKKNQHTTSEVLKCFLDYLFTSNYKNLLQYILCNVTESKQHTYATFCLVRLQPQPQEHLYLEPTLWQYTRSSNNTFSFFGDPKFELLEDVFTSTYQFSIICSKILQIKKVK